jgi:hypothetical protein
MVNRRHSSPGLKPEKQCILRCCPSRTRL